MKFSPGDKVLMKRTGEEGFVVGPLSKGMLEIQIGDITFPVYEDEVDHPYLQWFLQHGRQVRPRQTAKHEIQPEKPRPAARKAAGVYLTFFPEWCPDEEGHEALSSFKIFLYNERDTGLDFSYAVKEAGSGITLFTHKGSLHAFGHVYLHFLSLAALNAQPRIHCSLRGNDLPLQDEVLRIKPLRLVALLREMEEKSEPSFSIRLDHSTTPRQEAGVSMQEAINIKIATLPEIPALPAAKKVVDLHAEELPGFTDDMSSDEILQLQLNTLAYHLQLCIAHQKDKLTIIHGIGRGRLRNEVHHMLSTFPGIARYENDYKPGYGYGATEAFFE